jgi:DNA end-binding protein Ku
MKAIWTGSISFGLVEIPIKVSSAIQSQIFSFHVLHAVCHTRLEYQRWCPKCQEEVPWQDTVKGYEQENGSYRIFTKEELDRYKPEKTDRIDMIAFVPKGLIQDIFQQNHYYVLPDKANNKSYFLFHMALQMSGLVGIGRFVMREKEYLCTIETYEEGLLLNTLYYEYEIRPLAGIQEFKKIPKVANSEVKLASLLIAQMTTKKFDMSAYKDTYAEQLMKALKSKKKPAKTIKKSTVKHKKSDLESLLRGSLEKKEVTRPAAYASASHRKKSKQAPARKKTKKA